MGRPGHFELGGWKLVPGGIEVRGSAAGVIRRYTYATGTWTDGARLRSYPDGTRWDELAFGLHYLHGIRTRSGPTALTMPGSRTVYAYQGRKSMRLSPVIHGRRYVLTTSTLDVVDRTLAFPTVHVPLGLLLDGAEGGEPDRLRLLVEPAGRVALVIRTQEKFEESQPDHDLLLLDLVTRKVREHVKLKPSTFEIGDIDEATGLVKTPTGYALRTREGKVVRKFWVPPKLR